MEHSNQTIGFIENWKMGSDAANLSSVIKFLSLYQLCHSSHRLWYNSQLENQWCISSDGGSRPQGLGASIDSDTTPN